MSEQEYSELRKYAFNTAIHFCENYDLAEDIAQNSMLKFVNRNDISNPKSWIYNVVKNDVIKHSKINKNESNLLTISVTNENEDVEEFKISPKKLKSLLGSKYAKIYSDFVIKSNKNIDDYAKNQKITKSAAYKRAYALNKNLISIYKHADGWRGSKDLLRYEEMKSLQNFINKLNKGEKLNKTFLCEDRIYPTPNFELLDITIAIKNKDKVKTLYSFNITTRSNKGIEFFRYYIHFVNHSILKVDKCSPVKKVTVLPKGTILPKPIKGIIPSSKIKLYD